MCCLRCNNAVAAKDARERCQPKQVVKVSRMVANSENLSSLVFRGINGCNKLRVSLQLSLHWNKQKLEGNVYHNLELQPCHIIITL